MNKKLIIALCLLPVVILVDWFVVSKITSLLSEASDMAVVGGVLLLSGFLIGNFYLFTLYKKTQK